jgi:hypothetical protein
VPSLNIKERKELVEFVFHQRKKGMSNSEVRSQLRAKEIQASIISGIITEVEIRLTTPSNKGLISFIKKSHARIRIVIGAILFILGVGGAIYSYIKYGQLESVYQFLFIGMTGLGVYSTGKYALSKSKRPNKRFETSYKPMEK